MTVLTYKSEGNYFIKYLDKLSVAYNVNCDRNLEKEFKAKELITFEETEALKRVNFTYSKQSKYGLCSEETKTVQNAFKNCRSRSLKGVHLENIMLTCAEYVWRKWKVR